MGPRNGFVKRIVIAVSFLTTLLLLWLWKGCRVPTTPLEGLKDKSAGVTPVVVVEEHHEVLLYWYDAADKGLIKHEGNVLLHIDGHSDAAAPPEMNYLPFGRRPTLRDIHNMMQENDVFIAAAGLSGLIKRYIWVWPPFGVAEPVVMDHHVIKLQLGTFTRKNDQGVMADEVCGCVRTFPEDVLTPAGVTCVIASTFDQENPEKISEESCKIKITDLLMEVVSEAKAIELLESGRWITSHDSVILDIDEDYYGCEAPVKPLFDIKVTQSMVTKISGMVSLLFCPSKPAEELEADRFYALLIDTVTGLKQSCRQKTVSNPHCEGGRLPEKSFIDVAENMFQDLLKRNLKPILCLSEFKVKILVRGLLKKFYQLSLKQLKLLKEVGICFNGSPRTLYFDPNAGMRTCDGYNRPNRTSVKFHTPTEDEVTFRTRQLKVMLSFKDLHPGIVTVCRSVRDGYTPRTLFPRIEKDILDVLGDVFENVDRNSITYDPFLLGGPTGWANRHLSK